MQFAQRSTKVIFALSLGLISFQAARAQDSNSPSSSLPSVGIKLAWPALTFDKPLWLEESPDGSGRIFVVEQDGKIWIMPKDRSSDERKLFLDISDRKPHRQLEEGLLCMAFHPQFKSNGKFYIFYTQQGPKRNVLSEWQVSKSDADKADPATERILMEVPKPYWNHNGSTLLFGPDGYLYFSTGDGGGGYDPNLTAQNTHQILGKIMRIDVDSRTGSRPYGIPKDNPLVATNKDGTIKADPYDGDKGQDGERPEIWALGLRNVWRMSFDRETGQLWAGEVGQDKYEEVDIIEKGGNYGWSVREAFHPMDKPVNQAQKPSGKFIEPIIEYPHKPANVADSKFPNHSLGVSITGGYVYRGKAIPELRGVYVYGDYQMGTIWGLRYENGQLTADGTLVKENPTRPVSSFGEDSNGEIYVVSFDGKIYQLVEGLK